MHAELESLPESYKGLSCPQTEERLPEMPSASSYMFPCETRSQAHSSWEHGAALAVRLAVFPLRHTKYFAATGRTGLVPPGARSLGTFTSLWHPHRGPCLAFFHSFQAMIWDGHLPRQYFSHCRLRLRLLSWPPDCHEVPNAHKYIMVLNTNTDCNPHKQPRSSTPAKSRMTC